VPCGWACKWCEHSGDDVICRECEREESWDIHGECSDVREKDVKVREYLKKNKWERTMHFRSFYKRMMVKIGRDMTNTWSQP
jgi:hypothetical protein